MKRGKGPSQVGPRRPVALLRTTAEIMEASAYRRLLPLIEAQFGNAQYANLREKGAELRLTEIMDALRRSLVWGRYVYLIFCDAQGAY